jgi:outer membrane protein assembly factor BamB
LSREQVFLPCRDSLYSYPLDGGEPHARPWEPTQEGGNVVALEDRLLVAGNERLTAYGLRDQVFARLDRNLRERPHDPLPAMEMARVAYHTAAAEVDAPAKSADYERARGALDDALERAGGLALLTPEFQAALFADCLEFAELHLQENPAQLEEAVTLLTLAGECAPGPAQQLRQRVALAGVYGRMQQPQQQLEQYQYILLDRSLRQLPWPGQAGPALAGEVGREVVAEMISQHGREIYASYDDTASTLLAAATTSGDVQRLDHILAALPNSLAAPQALLTKGRILRRQKQELPAARCFYVALQRYPRQVDLAETIRELADSYVAAGQPAAAAWWLARGAREHPSDRVRHGDRQISLAAYREALGLRREAGAVRLPGVGWPLAEDFERPLPAPARVLTAELTQRPDIDWSRVFIHAPGELQALDPAGGKTLWSQPCAPGPAPRLIAALQSCLILATPYSVEGRDPQTGAVLWKEGETPAALDDPQSDPEDFPQYLLHALGDQMLVSCRSDGETVCRDLSSGRMLWKRPLDPRPVRSLAVANHFLAYAGLKEEKPVVVIAAMEDGAVLSTIELPSREPVLNLQPTLAGNMLAYSTRSLSAFDPLSGEIEWTRTFDESMLLHTARLLIDGVVVCTDGLRIAKLSLDDGSILWQSEPLRSQPGSVDLLASQDELHVLMKDLPGPAVTVLDLIDGRRLCDLRCPDSDIIGTMLTSDRLLLEMRTRPRDENPPTLWVALLPRPIHADRELSRAEGLTLGSFAEPVEIQAYDRGIIAHSEGVLHGWFP